MRETIDDGGLWWLPDAPDDKVTGWLTYEPERGAELRLVGTLRGPQGEPTESGAVRLGADDFERAGNYGRLHGQIGGDAVTLEDCFRTHTNSIIPSGLAAETVHVGAIYRGAWYEPDEDPGGDQIAVRLTHLVHWIAPAGITDQWHFQRPPGSDLPLLEINGDPPPDLTLSHGDGQIVLSVRQGVTGDGLAIRSVTQDIDVRYEAGDVQSSKDLLRTIGEFQDVVSLACDRTACFEHVVLMHPEVSEQRSDGEPIRRPIRMYARWSDRDAWAEPKMLTPNELVVPYSVLGVEGFQALLGAGHHYAAELRRVMATRRSRSMFNSDRLLNRCAALESFARSRFGLGDGSTFGQRIEACMELVSEPFAELVADGGEWERKLRKRRNHVAHHLDPATDDDGVLDLVLSESAYYLFVLCLLKEADLAEEIFDFTGRNGHVQWLRRELAEL